LRGRDNINKAKTTTLTPQPNKANKSLKTSANFSVKPPSDKSSKETPSPDQESKNQEAVSMSPRTSTKFEKIGSPEPRKETSTTTKFGDTKTGLASKLGKRSHQVGSMTKTDRSSIKPKDSSVHLQRKVKGPRPENVQAVTKTEVIDNQIKNRRTSTMKPAPNPSKSEKKTILKPHLNSDSSNRKPINIGQSPLTTETTQYYTSQTHNRRNSSVKVNVFAQVTSKMKLSAATMSSKSSDQKQYTPKASTPGRRVLSTLPQEEGKRVTLALTTAFPQTTHEAILTVAMTKPSLSKSDKNTEQPKATIHSIVTDYHEVKDEKAQWTRKIKEPVSHGNDQRKAPIIPPHISKTAPHSSTRGKNQGSETSKPSGSLQDMRNANKMSTIRMRSTEFSRITKQQKTTTIFPTSSTVVGEKLIKLQKDEEILPKISKEMAELKEEKARAFAKLTSSSTFKTSTIIPFSKTTDNDDNEDGNKPLSKKKEEVIAEFEAAKKKHRKRKITSSSKSSPSLAFDTTTNDDGYYEYDDKNNEEDTVSEEPGETHSMIQSSSGSGMSQKQSMSMSSANRPISPSSSKHPPSSYPPRKQTK
jgi:hypothetical protein